MPGMTDGMNPGMTQPGFNQNPQQQQQQQVYVRPKIIEPYISEKDLLDPWNQPYRYEWPTTKGDGKTPAVWSCGPDKEDNNGEGDDIISWDPQDTSGITRFRAQQGGMNNGMMNQTGNGMMDPNNMMNPGGGMMDQNNMMNPGGGMMDQNNMMNPGGGMMDQNNMMNPGGGNMMNNGMGGGMNNPGMGGGMNNPGMGGGMNNPGMGGGMNMNGGMM